MNLLGTKDINDVTHMKWITEDGINVGTQEKPSIKDNQITLNPMQTRTFLITWN